MAAKQETFSITIIMSTNIKYAKSHEWAVAGGDIATIGITDVAVHLLTDLVFLDLPKVGRTVTAGEAFGEVESVKAVSELLSPVSGTITEVNTDVANNLETLTTDPFNTGWLIKVKMSNPNELNSLLDKAAYDKHCAEEAH